ncbi:hypothetical protein GUJ93_ZPchr0006g41731 [Zizania palustris]|uniref:Uncharacterized protein n=1 Tax=Zizania palustris TaxID=103762 RepID=A0A8J5SN86_ZIZPA|nr:hypothetical protein GUJ93_ZPchr0006g41731 [Zizania palustris]
MLTISLPPAASPTGSPLLPVASCRVPPPNLPAASTRLRPPPRLPAASARLRAPPPPASRFRFKRVVLMKNGLTVQLFLFDHQEGFDFNFDLN